VKAILTYHSIDSSGSAISVAQRVFERHVRWMASGAVTVVSLPELLRLPGDRDAVAITFDDAYVNFEVEAWPRIREWGLPVTLFVPTGFVGRTNEWAAMPGARMPRLPILGWTKLSRLQEEGVTLGAHTRAHADLRQLTGAALREEVCGSSEDLLRETGRRPDSFAYPYGYCADTSASLVRAAFQCACTTELRPLGARDDAHLLPRLDAYYLGGPARLESFGRSSFREYIRARAGLRAAGQRLRSKWHR
jgi:peptidoglycan/xylan/chitin deacetylase (PgdA/CDA1 family)